MALKTELKIIDRASNSLIRVSKKVENFMINLEETNKKSKKIVDQKALTSLQKEMGQLSNDFNKLQYQMQKSGEVGSKAFNDTGEKAKGLIKTLSDMAKPLLSLQILGNIFAKIKNASQKVLNFSDTLSQSTSRLNLINDGLMTTSQLWEEIYESSQRANGDIIEIAKNVANLGLRTKGLFKSNKEIIQFSENLTKVFKISGASMEEVNSATLQLTQALGAGVLRGEELNAVFESAPMLIQKIADSMGVSIREIRKLASEGKITAGIVKDAVLGATGEINNQFGEIGLTFEGLGTKFKNIWTYNMMGVQEEIGKIPSSLNKLLPYWDALSYAIANAFRSPSEALENLGQKSENIFGTIQQYIKNTTSISVDQGEAMKIFLLMTIDVIESMVKKTGNSILNFFDCIIQSLRITVLTSQTFIMTIINNIAKGIDWLIGKLDFLNIFEGVSLSKGTTNKLNELSGFTQDAINRIYSKENYLNDKYFGKNLFSEEFMKSNTQNALSKVLQDRGTSSSKYNNINAFEGLDTTNDILNNINSGIGNIDKGISNLNDYNKSIKEIQEALYTRNITNQFNGTIQVISYGTDEEAQKQIAESTEQAIRRVIMNDYNDTIAIGAYA